MSTHQQPVRAKYQIGPNVFATCYLDVIEASDSAFRVQVGVHYAADSVLPVGTKVYLTPFVPVPQSDGSVVFQCHYVIVRGLEISHQQPVLLCTPIHKEVRGELRRKPRKQCAFTMTLPDVKGLSVTVQSGSEAGLTLICNDSRQFLGVVPGNPLTLVTPYKEEVLKLRGELRHLQYDWRQSQHILGVRILELSKVQAIMLNKLLDPNYTFEYDQRAAVDPRKSRIGIEE